MKKVVVTAVTLLLLVLSMGFPARGKTTDLQSFASAFPCPGVDTFNTQFTARLVVGTDTANIFLTGPTVVKRKPTLTEPDGRLVIPTEMLQLNLVGANPLTPNPNDSIRVNLSGPPTTGEVRAGAPLPGPNFPATSFFDVFAKINVDDFPTLFTYNPTNNTDPAHIVANTINRLPPLNSDGCPIDSCFDGKDEYEVQSKKTYDSLGRVGPEMLRAHHCPKSRRNECPPDSLPPCLVPSLTAGGLSLLAALLVGTFTYVYFRLRKVGGRMAV